ncbi:ATP-binding protein [Ramlibacter sp. MMS24-I3-19]|uniref:ATP-binding protein n=1 Tax=Ramlibacter sp. MMS24-I3-19 TaxID=3416606 RepID=UPI003CFDA161
MPTESAPERVDSGRPQDLAGRRNLLQLVQLRWLAVGGQLATILAVHFVMRVALPLGQMLSVLGLLVLFNLVSALRSRLPVPVSDGELCGALLVDVAALACQLYASGGISNPFVLLFLLQVAVAAVLLRPLYIWIIVAASTGALVVLTRWHVPLPLPGLGAPVLSTQYVSGLLVCFVLNAGLFVVFIGRIVRILRHRDASLARLRQRAAEEEHIVRMGLLASGAAHELGTPLATLSVIVGDWARMAPFAADPELREEIDEMQRQLERCKAIVSGILSSAGRSRAEAVELTSLHAFLDRLAADWERSRPDAVLEYALSAAVPDRRIVADAALRQMVDNVLDNALEAAPGQPVHLAVDADDEQLLLTVADRGAGFAPAVLERLGTPYQSSKGAPGRGLGLFLAMNVARTLGGELRAHNREGGGAIVQISLPLSALDPQPNATSGR